MDDDDTTFETLDDDEDEFYDEDESPTDQLDLVEMEELNEVRIQKNPPFTIVICPCLFVGIFNAFWQNISKFIFSYMQQLVSNGSKHSLLI